MKESKTFIKPVFFSGKKKIVITQRTVDIIEITEKIFGVSYQISKTV